MRDVAAVVGPTAVGKSAVAEGLALALGGEIVSADSMQVYRGMDIGTAKMPPDARLVPYHCIDLVDPGSPYSAALYQRDARAALADIDARGRSAVLVGGTGLYVRAALDAMEFPMGEYVSPVREAIERRAEALGREGLHRLLEQRDPESAALIHPNNVRRVVRALELLETGGPTYAEQATHFSERRTEVPAKLIGLTMQRSALYARIDTRVDAMVADGLLDEVRTLLASGYRQALTAAQAIGYKELVPVVEAGAELEEAVAAIKQATRRYAKRQLTWFRADPRIEWIDVTELSSPDTVSAAQALVESR
ncbi:MAG TPA: tRNA (adenosine(37)-N6)-dimethylallyltransferase MiaA [Coriobacteriia bacterium]